MVDPEKIFLTSSLITMQNLVAVSRVQCPKNLEDAMTLPLRMEGVIGPLERRSSPRVTVEFDGSRSNHIGVVRGSLWIRGVVDP